MWNMDPIFFTGFPETHDDIIPVVDIERPIGHEWSVKPDARIRPLPLPEDVEEEEGHLYFAIPCIHLLQG